MTTSLKISSGARDVETHSAAGVSKESHAFVTIEIDVGNGTTIGVEVDAGDWSRALALGIPAPVVLSALRRAG